MEIVNFAVSVILFAALVITVFLCVFSLVHCQSAKRTYFIVFNITVFLFVLGYLLEITAASPDGGFTATKVMYLGAAFFSPVFLLFVADFCEIKIYKAHILAPLLIVPFIIVILVWTTDYHSLIYTSYSYNTTAPVHHLSVTPGKLYYVNHGYALFCMMITGGILLNRLFKWDKRYRNQLILLFAGVCVPVAANFLFVLKLNIFSINYTPVSLAVLNVLLYINILRYDMFNILPKATAMALRFTSEAFVLVDTEMRLLDANPAAYRIFPDISGLSKGSDVTRIAAWPEALSDLSRKTIGTGIRFSDPSDENLHYSASVNTIYSHKNQTIGWVILIQDVTNMVMLMSRLENAACTDALTGIANRRHFDELSEIAFAKAAREENRCYIIMLDLDHFKRVNDKYGHPAGDAVLKAVSETVRKSIRPYDLFGRYGGEEFILLIADADEEIVHTLTERIRENIENTPCNYEDLSIPVTASLGIAASQGGSLEETVKRADEALYLAKEAGRNRIVLLSV